MDGMQEQTCAGCEFYEDNYKKALDRFLLYKEKIMCTQTLIQKYERRKQHNQLLLRKLQKSRQNVGAVRERFMHYMERYMPLEKSYNELTATHNDLEEKMRTQSSTLDALQQHNKQLSALVEVQEKGVNDYKEKCEYLQEELKRKLRINQIAKSKADDRYRNTVKSAIELAVLLKDKGMLPDSYKLCLRSWKKQLSQDIKPENLCDSGGQSPDKASSISSQDTGFDSSKSTSDDENLFDENAMGKKGAAGDKRCNTTLKSATPSISLGTSISDKSVNTRDIVRKSSTSRATQSYQNLRDVGVNTSVSMLTPGLSKFLHEMTISDCKNSGQSPSDQGMEDHDFEPLPFDPDSQIIDPHHSHRGSIFSPIKGAVHSANAKKSPNVEMSPSNDCVEEYHRGSIFSPVKGAVHSARAVKPRTSAEKPATSVHMSPSNDCVEEYQSSDEIATNNEAVTASSEMCSTDSRTSVLSSVKCDSFQADFGVSQTCSHNNSVFQQQPVQAGRMKKQNLLLMGKRSSSQKKIISNTTHDQDTERRNPDCKIGIKPLKRVCQKEHSSKYSSVLARFSTGKDDSSLHHSPIKAKMTSPKNILSDPKYTNVCTDDFVKSVAEFIRVKTLKYTKRRHRSRKLRRSILKTLHSPKKHFAANAASSSNSNVVKTTSGCFLETVNDTTISFCSIESTPKSGKFEEKVTFTETVNYRHDKPNVPNKVFDRTSKLSPLHCSTDVLASEKQQKEGRSHPTEKSRRRAENNILRHATHALTRVTQKQVGHKDPLSSNIVAHDFEPEVNNQTVKSLEKDEKDTENVVMELNSTSNGEGTVNNSECFEAITDTRLFSTNDNSNEFKRKDSDTVSCLGYTELLDDLSVSDDNSGPESINASSDLSHCVEAEGSDDECGSDSEVASNKFSKTAVPRNNVSNGTKCEVLNHDDIGSEKSCDKQCNSESIEEVFDHSNARYFIPQMLNDNESVVNYEEVETTIPIECTKEICVGDKSVDLLDPKAERESEVQKINSISEADESISEISTYLSASSNTDKRTTNNVEVCFSHLNSGSDGSNSEIATVNEKELELNSVSSSKSSTDSLAQPDIATDCTAEPSVPASTDNCTMDFSDVLHDNNTEIVIQGSEVNIDKDVVNQISKSPNDCASKKIDSVDTTRAKYNVGSELSKDSTEIHECTNEIINQCDSHIATKGHKHTKEKQCSDNNSINTCKDVNGTELMMVKSGLHKGTMKDAISDPHKICNIDVNGKSEKELEAITHTNSVLKEDLFTRKCGRRPVVSSCNVRKSLINGSVPEEPIVKEQQESNKYDIPVEKIPQAELDISKQEGKDTAEAYDDEYYYMPLRTKKRIAHKPKTRDSGSESCSEDKNFKSPIKAARKQTPRKTKPKTEDEQRDIKSVNQEAQNSSSKLLGHTVNEIGGGLQSLPLNIITDNMKEKCTLETKCSSSEVIENVNLKKEANKLKTETEKDTDALLNSVKKMQSKMVNSSVSEEPIIKEQQKSTKYDIPVEKIPEAELDISKQEGKDTTEAYGEEYYYMPLRTKKRIAHKPKTRDSGSESCSEDKNFKSPIKAARKQTPRKTKQKTEDEQRDIKSVNQEAQNSSSKLLGHTVNEIGGGLHSLPLNVISDNMKEKCTLETKCSSSEVTENVNLKNRAKKLKTETELGTDALLNSAKKMQSKMAILDKQLEQPSTNLQAARRSARLKKIDTVTLRQFAATKRRKKITDKKSSTADSIQEIVSIKTEPFDDCPSSSNMDHVKKEKCDINEASYAGEPVQPVQNSKIETLHKLQDDTDAGAVRPLIGGYKRKIQSETGGENSRKKVAPGLFKKQPHCQIKCENEANYSVSSSTLECAPEVNCKSEIQSSCMVLFPSDKNKCKEECADGDIPTSTSQENNKCGSVTNSGSRTSLEETGSNNATGHLNGEYIYERNNKESDITLGGIDVSYEKGDIIRKCLAIQQRNKLVARRPTRKIFNKQQVFVSQQLSELLGGDFTNEVLNAAIEEFGQDDSPVDAFALVRCVLKTLLQEDCNDIDRSHDVRAPPLSVVEEKLITFMITLRNRCSKFSTLIDDFLTAVEYHIFNFRTTPEYDVLHILTRFYAALCKAECLRERAQAFCYDALYCLKRKCFPIIYTILIYYPEAFPRASIGMTSPVCVCIVHSIFTSMNDANNTYLRIKPLITLLRQIYDYKLEEVLSCDLVDCFLKHLICQTSKSGEVCAAVTLLAKRKDRTWTLTQLLPKYIAPIIQEWRQGKINEAVMSGVIDIIGCVVKPFTEQCDLGPVLKIFKGILHTDKLTQSLKMKAALNLARQASSHFSEAAPILYEWVPGGELPNEFWEQMSDILSVKPHSFWRTFLKTCEETNEEMCVDSLNN